MVAEVGWFLHRGCVELFCDFLFPLCELAQKHALKIILLLAAELELSFFSDNRQIKDHAGDIPRSLCPHSCSLNSQFCVSPTKLKVSQAGQQEVFGTQGCCLEGIRW